jgi:hypothetical protein
VPENARRRQVEVEHFGSEVLEPRFGKQACQLAGAAAEVAAVAAGQRGWDTTAMRRPGRNSRAIPRSRAIGSGHMPTVLTASAALNGPSLMDRLSTGA